MWGSGNIAVHIFNLNTKYGKVVIFMPQLLYLWYPLDRRLSEPQIQSGYGQKENTPVPARN
jgi:hypothetical protein